MSRSQTDPPGSPADVVLTLATYLALFLFGLGQGVLGTFFFSSGPAPLASIGFDLAILATCLLGGWGLRKPAGALAPAVGWLVPVLVLASGTRAGSVLITASAAGEWLLFGGAASAAGGVVASFVVWSRPRRSPPGSALRRGGMAQRKAGA